MQVEDVQHKKYQENTNFCAHAFVLPNNEFRRQYPPSIQLSVTQFKIRHTPQDSHFIIYTYSNMPNQFQYRLLTWMHLGLLLPSLFLLTAISNLLVSTPTPNTSKRPVPSS
jgi:hypothetical protein